MKEATMETWIQQVTSAYRCDSYGTRFDFHHIYSCISWRCWWSRSRPLRNWDWSQPVETEHFYDVYKLAVKASLINPAARHCCSYLAECRWQCQDSWLPVTITRQTTPCQSLTWMPSWCRCTVSDHDWSKTSVQASFTVEFSSSTDPRPMASMASDQCLNVVEPKMIYVWSHTWSSSPAWCSFQVWRPWCRSTGSQCRDDTNPSSPLWCPGHQSWRTRIVLKHLRKDSQHHWMNLKIIHIKFIYYTQISCSLFLTLSGGKMNSPSWQSESSRQKLALCPSATLVPLEFSRS